ncbi:hypothetical protein ABT115_15220 [Streptomyces sp. NPDC001832]|uniref:hypothetical protein n=1 Tax=Streptomyces sp. NPDC001832 TaxID=3154527 RepID=UPI003327766C
MPQYPTTPDFLQRLAELEEQVAQLRRTGWERDELPFYPTSMRTMPYEDATGFTSVWETVLAPRTASLSLGLVFIGDQVGTTKTGGEWQVVLAESAIVMSGTITATFSYQFAAASIDLTPYRARTELKAQIQVRRTVGATTGGKFGAGGAIGMAPRYARIL